MRISRPFSRHAVWATIVGVTGVVAACDTSSSIEPGTQLWGFVTVSALRTDAGEHRVAPTAVFFRGALSSIPDARIKQDSCSLPINFTPPSGFGGVTYLDAGAAVTTTIGGVVTELPRVSTSSSLTYALATGNTVAYRPGDSIAISVPGVTGGYPTLTARGKTAEAFTMDPILPIADKAIQLRWTPATDNNSALVLSLVYTPSGTTQAREIRCSFIDDGIDSIPFTQHSPWTTSANSARSSVATRLRTVIGLVGDGAFELISTYQIPTPRP